MMVLEAMKGHKGHPPGTSYQVKALRVWEDNDGSRVVTNGYGSKNTVRFDSLEAALEHAREEIRTRGFEVTKNKLEGHPVDPEFDFTGGGL